MHRVIQETIAGLGGLDIIVNKCAAHCTSLSCKDTCDFSAAFGCGVVQRWCLSRAP